MKQLVIMLGLSVLVFGCSNFSAEDVKTAVMGQNYVFVDAKNDSMQLEFLENCARNFNWNKGFIPEWSVKEEGSKVLLNCNGHDFEPRQAADGNFEFLNAKYNEKLVKATAAIPKIESLIGEWENAHYVGFRTGQPGFAPPPPCPNLPNDTFLIPGLEFKQNTCIVTDLCEQFERPFSFNRDYGIISIGEGCDSTDQYKILKTTDHSMTVDVRFTRNGKLAYEYRRIYLKTSPQ